MTEKSDTVPEEKSDTTFRLLKQGRQSVFRGNIFKRDPDKKIGNKVLKQITKKSFVPYQLILDRMKGQTKEVLDNYMKQFESEIIKELPDFKKPVKEVIEPVVKKSDKK